MHSDKQLAGTQGRNPRYLGKRVTPKLYQKTKKSLTSDIKTNTMTAESGWSALGEIWRWDKPICHLHSG